ncbi:MAG: hypothetical protein R3B89_14715 [Polyangiaceae bacterium]
MVSDGDCCDKAGGCSSTPELVNPGAIEYIGNAVDDDCDGLFDEVDPPCDATVTDTNSADALDYARDGLVSVHLMRRCHSPSASGV